MTRAKTVVMSHLSDAQELTTTSGVQANQHINFAKFLILKTNGDLNQKIDPDALWKEFIENR